MQSKVGRSPRSTPVYNRLLCTVAYWSPAAYKTAYWPTAAQSLQPIAAYSIAINSLQRYHILDIDEHDIYLTTGNYIIPGINLLTQ